MRLFLALALFTSLAQGQTRFRELGRLDHLPADRDGVPVVELVDLNGDKNLDLVSVHARGLRILRGSSSGVFVESIRIDLTAGDPVGLATGDVDGDGDVDIVYFKWTPMDTSAKLLVNDGKGNFTAAPGAVPSLTRVTALALGDVDGDRDLDLFVGRGNGHSAGPGAANQLLLNDGRGRFSVASGFPVDADNATAAAFADVDRDNDLDLIVANSSVYIGPGPQNLLYLGNGSGGFTFAPSGSLPSDKLNEHGIATGDVNGDGNVDYVVSNNSGPFGTRPANLFLGDGKGKFTEAVLAVDAGLGNDVELVDVDGDSDLDLLVARTRESDGPRLYLNDGKGGFTRGGTGFDGDSDQNTSIVAGDVDRNGRVDFVTGNHLTRNHLHLGIGKLTWLDVTQSVHFGGASLTAVQWTGFELHDLDGDGDLDLLETGAPLALLLGDQTARFTDVSATHVPQLRGKVSGVWVADSDRDGDLDVFVHLQDTTPSWSVRLLVNRGNAKFDLAPASAIPFTKTVLHLTIDDLDGDGNVDLVVDSYGGPFLFRGNSKNSFTADTRSKFDSIKGLSPHRVADVDKDGDPDLVYKTQNHLPTDEFQVYANDGRGVFALLSTVKLPNYRVVNEFHLVDVDGDNAPDLAIADQQPALYMNDGKGRFRDETAKRFPVPARQWYSQLYRFADYDEDGDPDLFAAITNANEIELRYFTNTGGVFQDTSTKELGAPWVFLPSSRSVEALDFDADQDIDLVFFSTQGKMVLSNLYRHTHEPQLLGLGRTAMIEVFSHAPASIQFALVQVAAGATSIPIDPFGRLQVDLRTLVLLPPQLMPANGHLELVLPTPSDPRLVGLVLHTQSLLLMGPIQAWRYTNLAVSNPLIR